MTIKKRLFISNILMIVIPIILALFTMLIAYGVVNVMFHGSLYDIIQQAEELNKEQFGESIESMRAQIAMLALLFMAGVVAITYFTNRFLTKFVFRKIEQPLEMLSQGVRQIKNGNLDHRIEYDGPDEFQPVCEDFNDMAVRLKSSVEETLKNEQSRKELIAGISHDLRSPLTSIKAYVEGLIDGVAVTPEAQREYLQTIKTKTDDISKMVSQLFLFSKMDTGNYPVNLETLDIGREITDFVNVTQEDYAAKGLTVRLNELPEAVTVTADPVQIRSVFTNILDNSAKYSGKASAEAVIHCEVNADTVQIIFDDNGAGVQPDALPKLFDVFYRSDVSRNNPQQGSGLGLAIAVKMLERMNGSIYAKNRTEGGLRIVIKIPVREGATK
ncbi:MAG: HAMP domain-containing protein [Oscillospiraceae bacterium]|jgi:signal transduction histidine kinase|nr:HAMP domain-containing protein [Oscillospiraceae bacterium]